MKKLLISYGLLLSMLIVGVGLFNYGYSLSGFDLAPQVLAYDDDDDDDDDLGGGLGSSCESNANCGEGLYCYGYRCKRKCEGDSDCTNPNYPECTKGQCHKECPPGERWEGDMGCTSYGDDDDDDDDDGPPPCTKERRTGYFDKEGCYQYSKSDSAGFEACKRDGYKYVSLKNGFRMGCSNYHKGDLCSLKDRRLICPVDTGGDLDQLKREYKDAKKIKKAAWQNYLMIKKQSKTSYKADKKEKWEEYKSAKKEMLDEYKDIRSAAKSKYLDEKQTAKNAYKKLKDPARAKYKDANEAYQKSKAKYKKCREKKSKKECKDERDDYKEKRGKRNDIREEYVEIRDAAKAKYVSLRDNAKEEYLDIRNKAKKNFNESKKDLRAAYDKSKDLLRSKSKAAIQNARSEYDAKKKIYLDAKAAYDKVRGK